MYIEANLRLPVIKVGNLNVKRNFTDVRDIVKSYLLLMEHGCWGEIYNIGFQNSISSLRDIKVIA